MLEFFVAMHHDFSLVRLPPLRTPGFPSFASEREGYCTCRIQPAALSPGLLNFLEQELADCGVDPGRDRLAVVQFERDGEAEAHGHNREAVDRWCDYALRMGWRLWSLPLADILPPHQIVVGEGAFLQSESLSFLVVPPKFCNPAEEEAA